MIQTRLFFFPATSSTATRLSGYPSRTSEVSAMSTVQVGSQLANAAGWHAAIASGDDAICPAQAATNVKVPSHDDHGHYDGRKIMMSRTSSGSANGTGSSTTMLTEPPTQAEFECEFKFKLPGQLSQVSPSTRSPRNRTNLKQVRDYPRAQASLEKRHLHSVICVVSRPGGCQIDAYSDLRRCDDRISGLRAARPSPCIRLETIHSEASVGSSSMQGRRSAPVPPSSPP